MSSGNVTAWPCSEPRRGFRPQVRADQPLHSEPAQQPRDAEPRGAEADDSHHLLFE
jgi:hypothetical protein